MTRFDVGDEVIFTLIGARCRVTKVSSSLPVPYTLAYVSEVDGTVREYDVGARFYGSDDQLEEVEP